MVAGVTAVLAESTGSLPSGLWLTSPAGCLPRTGISSGTLHSVIEYGLPLPFLLALYHTRIYDYTKALVWPITTYGCKSWTIRKNEETRPNAFKMNGLRKILRVSWTAKKTNEWVFSKAGVLWSHYEKTRELHWERECKEQCQMHAGEEDHARPGWTTSRRGQDSPWKSPPEWQRAEINGESTSMVWPTLGSRTAK